MESLAIATVQVLTWFLQPFAFLVVTSFIVSLFRKN